MASCAPYMPGPRRGGFPAPPFRPDDYWAARKWVASYVGGALGSVRSDVSRIDRDKQDRLTAAQRAAVDSGIDAGWVARIRLNSLALSGKADLVDGMVPASQLPSYVDDVLEFASASAFPATGERGKIYIALDTNRQYRWSGTRYVGLGGGEDINAVHYYAESKTDAQKAQVRENIGAMAADTPIPQTAGRLPVKPLPKYLHELRFDDPYDADAEAWYESLAPDAMGGACSAVRRGGRLFRNYDWTFDDAAEFVVRMSAADGRHASVGVASLGAALSEDEAASGVYTAKHRALPGMTLDGINDAGVVCEINVDGGPKSGWHGDADDEGIHILAAVRWALDHGETAAEAAEWLADHIIQPTGDMNFHFMVADATKTYIVENGEAHDVTDGTKVLTNYALYDDAHTGGGKERYQLLAGGADISAAHWTNAYQSGNTWHSDFESEAQHAEAIEQWAAQGTDKEAHRGRTTASGKPWWQTVHTSEYDFAARTMRVAVQESGKYFTFAAGAKAEVTWEDVTGKPETFPPTAHEHAQSDVTGLADALAAKRGKDDLAVYPKAWITTGLPEGVTVTIQPMYSDGKWIMETNGVGGVAIWNDTVSGEDENEINHWQSSAYPGVNPVSKCDVLAKASQLSDNNYTDADKAEVAKVKDKADEFTPWEYDKQGVSIRWDDLSQRWTTAVTGATKGDLYSTKLHWNADDSDYNVEFTATRKRVLRTGEAATPQEVASKFDTSKAIPAYSASLTYEVGEIVLHDGVAYKCVTAITTAEAWNAAHWSAATDAEIAARIKCLKSDGFATDGFAADLLGKQVAKEAVQDIIADDVEPATDPSLTKTIATIGGKAIKAPVGGGSQGYAFFDLTPTTESGYKVFTAQDHAINRFTLADATPVKVILPNAADANGRDFILKVNVTSATMPTFEIVKPSDAASVGIEAADDGWADLEAGINYFTITETDRA